LLLNTCETTGVKLAIARSNGAFTISWVDASGDYILEPTTNLSADGWQAVAKWLRPLPRGMK
jgi:hypothetical protein